MSLGKRIFLNTLTATIGKVVAIAIGLITLAVLTQSLRETGYGQYTTVTAFLQFFITLADLGLYLYIVREISLPGADSRSAISNVLGMRLVFSLVFLASGAVLASFLPYDRVVKQAMFIGIAAFVSVSLNQALFGIFQKHLVLIYTSIAELFGRAVNLGLILYFIHHHFTLNALFIALVCGNGVIFLLAFLFARRFERFSIAFDLQIWKKILRQSWPLAFAVILNLVYFKTDTIILSWYFSADVVGVYGVPYKILEVLLAFPGIFVGLVMPLLSREAGIAWDKFQEVLQRSFEALLLVVIPMIIATLFFAQDITNLIKGKEGFADAASLLQILIVAAGVIFIGTLFGYAVVAVGKQKQMVIGYLLTAAGAVGLYFWAIPRFSYFGAAYSTVAVELFVALFAYIVVYRASGRAISLRILVPTAPAIAILIFFYKFAALPWLVEFSSGLLLYGVVLILFRAIPREFVLQILRRGSEQLQNR